MDDSALTVRTLSELSGVSISFLSDLINGKANPSLEIMEVLARVFEVPLPLLLELHDLDDKTFQRLMSIPFNSSAPQGYERVAVLLPKHQAYLVKKWAKDLKLKNKEKS